MYNVKYLCSKSMLNIFNSDSALFVCNAAKGAPCTKINFKVT